MAVDFDAWAKTPNRDRVLLVEVNYHDGTSEKTRYLSTRSATEFGYYDSVIDNIPVLKRTMPQTFGGEAKPAYGYLDINNAEGRFDDWITDSWGGRDINFYLGDYTWQRSDFSLRFSGVVDRLEIVSDSTLRFHIKDHQHDFDKPIQETFYTTGESIGQPKPLCFGAVKNITPVLIDKDYSGGGEWAYQIHDGAVTDACTQLYVNGASSALSLTKVNASGLFYLTAGDPSGTVTCDASGAAYTKSGAIIREIVTTYGGLTDPTDLDTTSFTDYDTGAPTVGIYIKNRTNMLQVLDELIKSHLGWYGFDRDGKFEVHKLSDPSSGTSVLSLDERTTTGLVNMKIDLPPRWQTSIGYDRNYTVQRQIASNTGVVDFVSSSYSEKTYEDTNKTTIQAKYKDALAPTIEHTQINSVTDANTEAQFRQGLFNSQRYLLTVNAFASAYTVDIGQVADISDDRYSLSSTKFLITSIDEDMVNSRVTLGGWF